MNLKEKPSSNWTEPELRNFIGRDLEQTLSVNDSPRIYRGLVKTVEIRDVEFTDGYKKRLSIYHIWLVIKQQAGWILISNSGDSQKGMLTFFELLDDMQLIKNLDGSYEFSSNYIGEIKILPEGDHLKREDVLVRS